MIEPALTLASDGWLCGAVRIDSANRDDRPAGVEPHLIVLHAISLPPGQFGGDAIQRFFTNQLDPDGHPYFHQIAELRVSAHFLIPRDGALIQFVSTDQRAWHAGTSCWRGLERCNDFSIGIELEGDETNPFDGAQYRSLASLLAVLKRRYPFDVVAAHSDIAPARKCDPGPRFDWRLLSELIKPFAIDVA